MSLHYTFVIAIECATPRVNRNVSYELWVIMMCQHWFISCNKRATIVWDVEGSCDCVEHMKGRGEYTDTLCNFPLNLKTALKKEFCFLKDKGGKKELCSRKIQTGNSGE